MSTKIKKNSRPHGLINILTILGLVALLFSSAGSVEAQTNGPSAPLSPRLTWMDFGPGERAFTLNGESVTLSGTVYKAVEEFNLDDSDEIADYYSTVSLGGLGWTRMHTTPYPNGVSSVYFHPGGVYAMVEFVGCMDNPALTCMTVWVSDPASVFPAPGFPDELAPQALGTLNKSLPANNATNIDTNVTLSWTAYTGTDFSHYRYCVDKTNDDECDAAITWTSVWSGTSVNVTALESGATYYWQVQAVLNDGTRVSANGGTWWKFTIKVLDQPGAFTKVLPSNGAAGQPVTPTLVWQTSSNATDYLYCIDTTNNNICDNNWVSTSNKTFVTLMSGIGANITYYWQVRAINGAGLYHGDGGAWASFTTAAGPANDTIDGAFTAGVPYENSASTTSATVDDRTQNLCSPALGFSSVWYKYTAASTRKIYLDSFGTSYNTFIAVWTKNANGTLNPVICNDDSSGVTQSNINLSVTNGTTYYIQVAQKNLGSTPSSAPGGSLAFHVRNFADVAGNNVFWRSIEGIYAAGITGGCATSPDLLYCPTVSVNRATMAVFLLKSIHGSSYTPPAAGTDTGFLDVPVGYWAAAWIKQLAAEGITTGCAIGYYCPGDPVTRAQMAVFLLRGEHGAGYNPPAVGGSTGFTDVPTTYWASAWIKQLAAEGITSGCAAGLYCPENQVTREQMAVFLSKTFGIPTLP